MLFFPIKGNDEANIAKESTYWKTATSYGDPDDGNGHFFIYFLTVVGMCILMYVLFHNKQKVNMFDLFLEEPICLEVRHGLDRKLCFFIFLDSSINCRRTTGETQKT